MFSVFILTADEKPRLVTYLKILDLEFCYLLVRLVFEVYCIILYFEGDHVLKPIDH